MLRGLASAAYLWEGKCNMHDKAMVWQDWHMGQTHMHYTIMFRFGCHGKIGQRKSLALVERKGFTLRWWGCPLKFYLKSIERGSTPPRKDAHTVSPPGGFGHHLWWPFERDL